MRAFGFNQGEWGGSSDQSSLNPLVSEMYVVDRQEFEAEPTSNCPKREITKDGAGEDYQVVCPITGSDNNDHCIHDGFL